ncbi:hypothetical protein M9H77_30664 [Catharanthus roseus]|uniref:Uncharacterized protein n=1 Tax=Catharanthus roseus TaxID=4058 RepID=A0ACC0A0H9_CATRO|nr:hypothetical protein M9H77_30664 [Catharanthus roseus]
MSKEDFCDFMSDMSSEEAKSIEIERKDRVEEKERLVKKSSFFDSISSLGEKCEKDECSKEKENDLEKNERTKEMSEEKREEFKRIEKLNLFEKSKDINVIANETNSSLINRMLFGDVMEQRDHSLFVNVPYQVINLDSTYLLVVKDLFHAIFVSVSHDVDPWNNCDSLGVANC